MKKTISLVLVLVLGLATKVATADFTFGTPTNLGPPVNTSGWDTQPSISADGLTLYFCSHRTGGFGNRDIYVATRETTDDDWGTPVNLGSTVNSSALDDGPSISADGLSLYFCSLRPGDSGLWLTRRETTDEPFGPAVNFGPPVDSPNDAYPSISGDDLSLFFGSSNRPGGSGNWDLYVTTRKTRDDDWGTPVGATVNTSYIEGDPGISGDGLVMFFGSDRPGGYGGTYGDILVTTRATTDDDWSTPVNLGPVINSSSSELGASISADGSILYFSSDRPGGVGGYDIYQAPIIPVVDLNGDGIVDSADMCIMVDHWGENNPLCDIGPTPLGDGIVDVQDLIVLSEHLFEDLNDPTLVAHWALDDIEGDIASDSANDNDGTVYGDPAWQPEGGMVDGALQLDGIDDYVNTPFVLNPADGKFSVFVWIKGGAPGQVVIAQKDDVNWLCTDSLEGNLMTELKGAGRDVTELPSQTIITDGDWHRIALVWDGSLRTLYVDDVAVAEDEQTNLAASENGLYIGTGTAMEPGSFWSGLIDDIRIYNRAVTP